jgi:two-component system, LuxR family, sensor kinase FixL
MVEIAVADTGPGVDPAMLEQLFQPFVTTKAHGMGVGLSISRTIVEAHGGRIWVEANEAGGATFRFTLRAVPEGEIHDRD